MLTAVLALWVSDELTLAQCLVLLSRDVMTAIGFAVARAVPWLRPVSSRRESSASS